MWLVIPPRRVYSSGGSDSTLKGVLNRELVTMQEYDAAPLQGPVTPLRRSLVPPIRFGAILKVVV